MSPGQESPFSVKSFNTQFHSAFLSYARGVSVLISTNVFCVCTTSLVDPYGRYIFLACSLERLHCIIVNIYIYTTTLFGRGLKNFGYLSVPTPRHPCSCCGRLQ